MLHLATGFRVRTFDRRNKRYMSETRLPGKLNQPRSSKIACERYMQLGLQCFTRADCLLSILFFFLLDRILIYAVERCTAER